MKTPYAAAVLVAAALTASAPARAHGPTVTIGHNRVSPAEIHVQAGEIVHFHNVDEMPGGHSIVADDGSFESPPLGKGGDWHRLFPEAGEYRFHIGEHPDARGVIIVEESPDS